MKDILINYFHNTSHPTSYFVALAFLALVAVALALLMMAPKFRELRPNFAVGIVIVTLLGMVMIVNSRYRWHWIVGLLPALMVGYQLFFLWFNQPRDIGSKLRNVTGSTPSGGFDRKGQPESFKAQSYKRAKETVRSHFSPKTLFMRYGLPAVLLGITGTLIVYVLVEPDSFFSVFVNHEHGNDDVIKAIMHGMTLGAAGAYVYVLLELGRRTFRQDVTGAVAMWCWVTLVLGPVLSATVAFLWRGNDAASGGWWGSGVVLFFTGFAPRRVMAAIERAAGELLNMGGQTVVQSRVLPLSQIRGIGPQIEERLSEEGVYDVNTLASSEPVRLVRNTPYDMRQILGWIDEALLIVTLPRSWEALEEVGITGAIDLAWYYDQVVDENDNLKATLPPAVTNLATKVKLDDPLNLAQTIQRLSEDTQVQYIWALYNNFTEYSLGEDVDSQGGGDTGQGGG